MTSSKWQLFKLAGISLIFRFSMLEGFVRLHTRTHLVSNTCMHKLFVCPHWCQYLDVRKIFQTELFLLDNIMYPHTLVLLAFFQDFFRGRAKSIVMLIFLLLSNQNSVVNCLRGMASCLPPPPPPSGRTPAYICNKLRACSGTRESSVIGEAYPL